jgi:hypothetical protein
VSGQDGTLKSTSPEKRGSLGGHVLVASCACLLTVAIVGSAVFLAFRVYDRYRWGTQVQNAVASLQHRTAEELAELAAQVKASPKLTRLVLPEVLRTLRDSKSEQQQCSAIRILRAFVEDKSVERALFRLRRDDRESVAAAAVEALAGMLPPERAASALGRCLDPLEADQVVDSVIDEACAGLFSLGKVGRLEIEGRLPLLSADRRVWLVGYVSRQGGSHCRAWLEMLRRDGENRVREAAGQALQLVGAESGEATRGDDKDNDRRSWEGIAESSRHGPRGV